MLVADHPVSVACRVLRCARSSYYHQGTEPDEAKLKAAIEAVAAEWPTYGSRRVTAQLRRQGWTINRKRVQRLMRQMDIQVKIKRKGRKTTNSEHGFPRYPNLCKTWLPRIQTTFGYQTSPTSDCSMTLCTWQ